MAYSLRDRFWVPDRSNRWASRLGLDKIAKKRILRVAEYRPLAVKTFVCSLAPNFAGHFSEIIWPAKELIPMSWSPCAQPLVLRVCFGISGLCESCYLHVCLYKLRGRQMREHPAYPRVNS
jgi:hypothetical protein